MIVDITPQTEDLMKQLIPYGVFGTTVEEIAKRFIGDQLYSMMEKPTLKIKGVKW